MKRRTTAYASIAILLAIVVLVTGCNPSASKQEDAATTMMRAMSQVAASKNYSSGEQNVNYTADDGSKITGKMTIDSNGEIEIGYMYGQYKRIRDSSSIRSIHERKLQLQRREK